MIQRYFKDETEDVGERVSYAPCVQSLGTIGDISGGPYKATLLRLKFIQKQYINGSRAVMGLFFMSGQ